jgi:PAS domain S-box-containing protein
MPDLLEHFSKMSDAVIAVDGEQRILLVNRAAEALLGLTARDVLGRPCYEVIRGRDKLGAIVCQQACRAIALAGQGEPIPSTDILTLTKRGQPLWLNVTCFTLPLASRGQVAVIHLFRDLSRQKAMEQVLGQFAANVAELSVGDQPATSRPDVGEQLTHRERQVLELLAQGFPTRAIAEQLRITWSTVRTHIQNILSKLGVQSRLQAVALARRRRLL